MTRLGKYELVQRLAMGGMAEVFLARFEWARGLEKTVVVKRILPHLAQDAAFREMFFGEAQLAAQLNHPGIAQIIEFGESEGTYFLAMEYVDGPSLRALEKAVRARGERIPFAHGARIAASCCEALAHAHELIDAATGQSLHLVHRDVSPDNILIARNGAVKVVDFGIAKAASQTHHTQAGMVKGKVAYMSPEQVRAESLDRRSDVYALGVVLYEMISGGRPFEGPNDLTLMTAKVNGTMVPLRTRCPDVPEALEAIVNRALQRSRDDRYPDCRAMAAELEEALIAGRQPASAFQIAQLVERYGGAGAQRTEPAPKPSLATPERLYDPVKTPAPVPAEGTDAKRDAAMVVKEEPLARTGTDGQERTVKQPLPLPPDRRSNPRAVPVPVEMPVAEEPTLSGAPPPQPPQPSEPPEPSRKLRGREAGAPLSRRRGLAAALGVAAIAIVATIAAFRSGAAKPDEPVSPPSVAPASMASAPVAPAPVASEAAKAPPPVEAPSAPVVSVTEPPPSTPTSPGSSPAATAAEPAVRSPALRAPAKPSPVVELTLRSEPPSQLKILTGRKVLAQARNSLTVRVPPGTVVVEATDTGENRLLKRETLTLGTTPRQVSHTIVIGRGSVVIRTFPAAHVTVDGIPRGDVPLKLSLFEGPHTVRLECDRSIPLCSSGLAVTKPVVVAPGKSVEVTHKWQ
ncbi:MAG TPA: protein kinase [Myxococcaceae bacterium]